MTKQTKSMPINIRLSKGDISLLDFIASREGQPRAKILASSIEHDVMEMFETLGYNERAHLANLVDEALTKEGFQHEYMGKTWYWLTVGQDPNIDNPEDNKDWNQIYKNLSKGK
jgi:predicted DNA-binding protein